MKNPKEVQGGTLLEIRRIFPLLGAVLIALSILLPFWSVTMKAPQYPEKDLVVKIYANKMAGDVWEVNTLNQYAGVKFPEKIPEFKFFPGILIFLALLSLLTAFAPTELRSKLLPVLVGIMAVFLIASLVDLQWRLYNVGHLLDPNAPMAGVQPFTPPILGPNKIANFSTFSLLGAGGISIGVSFILNLAAFFKRRSTVTITQWGSKLSQVLDS